MQLIFALATFGAIMAGAVVAALVTGWVISLWPNLMGRLSAVWFKPLSVDPAVEHLAGLQHSHERWTAHQNAHPADCSASHAGGSGGDCGGAD